MISLVSVQTADAYPSAPGSSVAWLAEQIGDSNGGYAFLSGDAIAQILYGDVGNADWSAEFVAPKGGLDLDPGIAAIRFRSKTPGTPVTVSAALFRQDEPAVRLSAGGLSSLSLTFQHNGATVANEPILDFEDTANQNAWALTDNSATQTLQVKTAFTSPAVFPGSVSFGGLTDNTIGRLAAAVVGSTTSGLSTGPTVLTAGGGGVAGVFLQGGLGRIGIFNVANDLPFRVSLTSDTQYRYTMDNNGLMSWGPGGASALDVTLARTQTGAPSSGGIGLTTASSLYATSTQGFVYTGATNQQALGSYFAAADANPAFKIFSQGAMVWGPGGASGFDVELARIVNAPTGTGSFLELIKGQGLGYGTGTGGTVAASAFSAGSSTCTLNTPVGQITMPTVTIGAGATATITVTNSCVGADDVIVYSFNNIPGAFTPSFISHVGSGSFVILLQNQSAASVTWPANTIINFAVIKGAVS